MDKELKITENRVLEAASCCEDAKRILKKLFPETFKKDEPLYKIGQTFIRKEYNNIYALQKQGKDVFILNVTHCARWVEVLDIKDIKDTDLKTVTQREFKKLTGSKDLIPFDYNDIEFKKY